MVNINFRFVRGLKIAFIVTLYLTLYCTAGSEVNRELIVIPPAVGSTANKLVAASSPMMSYSRRWKSG